VTYREESATLRSVPLSWTDLRLPDMFLEVSAGRSIVHPKDLRSLQQLAGSLKGQRSAKEGPRDGPMEV